MLSFKSTRFCRFLSLNSEIFEVRELASFHFVFPVRDTWPDTSEVVQPSLWVLRVVKDAGKGSAGRRAARVLATPQRRSNHSGVWCGAEREARTFSPRSCAESEIGVRISGAGSEKTVR